MEHKLWPLKQHILSRSQWVRVVFIGLLTAIATVYLESKFEGVSNEIAETIVFSVFSVLLIALALSARSEKDGAFNRDIFRNSLQQLLYGIALLMVVLPARLAFLQDFLGLTEPTFDLFVKY